MASDPKQKPSVPVSDTSSSLQTPQKKPQKKPNAKPDQPLYLWHNIHPASRLVYIRDPDEADIELSTLRHGPVGFDLEWKPNFVKGHPENRVALVQLANEER